VQGKISEENVLKIISSTRCPSKQFWLEVIGFYLESYWLDFPEAEQIAWSFIDSGRVIQPCLGESLGPLEGKIPLMQNGSVYLGKFGAIWIDPETYQPVDL
jgi:hypothetical protein